MRKLVVAVCMVFVMAFPAFAQSWTFTEDSLPPDSLLAESVQRWQYQHRMEIRTILTGEQRVIFDELIRGILTWAHTRGNRFDRNEFLASFQNRDDSVYVIPYPDGGIGLVIRGVYIRVQLDQEQMSSLLENPAIKWPEEGRWFAEIGCDSHSQIFYFLVANSDELGRIVNSATSCQVNP